MVTAAATYYAHWTANQYTVTLNGNGHTIGTKSITVTYDGTYSDLTTGLSAIGYTFDGWYTAASGGTQVTTSTKVTKTAAHTLYAHWTAKSDIKVSFDANGGSFKADEGGDINVTYGQPYGTLPTPTKEGSSFVGWQDASGSLVTSSTLVKTADNHTLTAQWQTTHTHKVNPNGSEAAVTFTPLTTNGYLSPGRYYLNGDITGGITVSSGATLNLCDCAGGGSVNASYGIKNSGTVTVNGGTISGKPEVETFLAARTASSAAIAQQRLNEVWVYVDQLPAYRELAPYCSGASTLLHSMREHPDRTDELVTDGTNFNRALTRWLDRLERLPDSLDNFIRNTFLLLEDYFEDLPSRTPKAYAIAYGEYRRDILAAYDSDGDEIDGELDSFKLSFPVQIGFAAMSAKDGGAVLGEVDL